MISTAPCGPITASSAVGHAYARSAPMDFEFMTTYAPPYALRVMIWMRGTVASQYAYSNLAPWRMMPLYSWSTPGKKPGTSTNVIRGMLNASQVRTNLAAFDDGGDDLAHVVGHVGAVRHEVAQLRALAIRRILRGDGRRHLEVVRREERKQIPHIVEAGLVVRRHERGD